MRESKQEITTAGVKKEIIFLREIMEFKNDKLVFQELIVNDELVS